MAKRSEEADGGVTDVLPEDPPGSAVLEALLSASPAASGDPSDADRPTARVGFCVDDRHPVLQGRVRVGPVPAETDAGNPASGTAAPSTDREPDGARWLPVLQGITVRTGDRVLVVQPEGWDESVVVGVVDGFRRREDPPVRGGPTLEMRRDEALTIVASDGTPVVRLRDLGDGPEVHLLAGATRIRLPGALELSAESLLLRAEKGEVRLEANDDVVVRGEVIKLN